MGTPVFSALVHAVMATHVFMFSAFALAQEWPSKPVRMIVPFPPGQGADIIGRLLAERLTPVVGQPVVVDNRPGAGSMVGTAYAAKQPADGYTWFIGGSSAMVINPHLYRDPGYDTLKDFVPITNIASLPMVICVNSSFPAHSIPDLIKIARERPGEVIYGSSGNGSTHHLVQALLASMAGITLTHVPYKGSTASMTDLDRRPHHDARRHAACHHAACKSGQGPRASASHRSRARSSFRKLPTLDEQGVKGFDAIAWAGLFVPAGTPGSDR